MENAINETQDVDGLDDVGTKMHHAQLKLDGVCVQCAHCGLKLTDSVSIERGLGPTCSKHGYLEDPKDGDMIEALILLSEYQELVDFLTRKYKPQGVRGLMNGLVRVCSLNRKHDVFRACCDAIEVLGYDKLASTLRKSIISVSIYKVDKHPGCLAVSVKRRDWRPEWQKHIYNNCYNARFDREERALIVPIHHPDNVAKVAVNADHIPNREVLWNSLVEFYPGLVLETSKGNIVIRENSKSSM